jgi:hypothetical protein
MDLGDVTGFTATIIPTNGTELTEKLKLPLQSDRS